MRWAVCILLLLAFAPAGTPSVESCATTSGVANAGGGGVAVPGPYTVEVDRSTTASLCGTGVLHITGTTPLCPAGFIGPLQSEFCAGLHGLGATIECSMSTDQILPPGLTHLAIGPDFDLDGDVNRWILSSEVLTRYPYAPPGITVQFTVPQSSATNLPVAAAIAYPVFDPLPPTPLLAGINIVCL